MKANCQLRFRFMQWQMNEDVRLNDVEFSFTHPPKLHHLHTTGLVWLLDNLRLIRPIVYLNERFLYPKRAFFKFKSSPVRSRRPPIGCPAALFCIDVIQAENIPMTKSRKKQAEPASETADAHKPESKLESHQQQHAGPAEETEDDLTKLTSNLPSTKRCALLNCLNYKLPSVFCNVRIFNQQFTSPSIQNTTSPFWNFRSFIPIFSHNKHSIDQLEKYHTLFNDKNQEHNPIDLNASFYQFQKPTSQATANSFKQFVSYDLLENLSINIQLMDRQDAQSKLIAEFQIQDPSQYFLDAEFNGQSIWITSAGVLANVDQSIKLNVRFTFLTLNQTLNPTILTNAYLANRLAFPIGVLLVFVDSAIGLDVESLKSNLNLKSTTEYGIQIVCQLGNQILYTSVCTDLSFIWENELLFYVYSLSLEQMSIKLVARSLNASNFELTTIATSKLELADLIDQPTHAEQYVPLVLKSNSVQLKLLLSFRIVHFTTKLTTNCLRNAKVAEEDVLVREKQIYIEEKLKSGLHSKQISFREDAIDESSAVNRKIEGIDLSENQLEHDSNEDQSVNSVEPVSVSTKKTSEIIHILVSARMRWPKMNKFVIELVDLRCAKFLTLFQMYSIDVYLNCVLREKEKALQSKRTKNFQLKQSTVPINQELQFNCISKPLSAYHLNISLHEKRTEEYSKVAELYTSLPSPILGSGQIDKQFVLNLTPMFLKISGFHAVDYAEYEFDAIEQTKT